LRFVRVAGALMLGGLALFLFRAWRRERRKAQCSAP
jgi:hypothetical protein